MFAAIGGKNLISELADHGRHQLADFRLVVNDHYNFVVVSRHGTLILLSARF